MNKIRLGFCVFLIMTVFATLAFALHGMNVTTPVEFEQVGAGSLLLRDKNDKIYSTVIKSYEGLEKFKALYPIKFEMTPEDAKEEFKYSFYIIGFSDNHLGVEADGFKRQRKSSDYYLDLATTGEEFDAGEPVSDKKYTSYVIIRVSDNDVDRETISHIQIREGVVNGQTQWF